MVKCAECGFLAIRNTESRELEEAEEIFREKGVVPTTGYLEGQPTSRHEPLPLCFAQVCDLKAEFKKADKMGSPGYVALDSVIHMERDCSDFTPWQQGFTPKEHREMLDRQEWRDWQERQRKADRRWRIIEIGIMVIMTGGFIVLGALIGRGSIP